MRAVATAAAHQVAIDGVTEGLQVLGALLLVALEAHLGLLPLRTNGIVGRVHLMAVGAGNVVTIVRAVAPGVLQRVGMTTEASLVLLRHGRHGVEAEIGNRRSRLAAADASRMRATGSVAGLALQLTGGKRRVLGA
jgi:hypothetical protein